MVDGKVEEPGFSPALPTPNAKGFSPGPCMPRIAPQEIRTFFVTTVTHGRRCIFQTTRNAELFLAVIADDRSKLRYAVHELVLMPDHVHLILTPAPDTSLEKAIQFIKGGFSFRAKRDLGASREIWQAGYTEHRIRDSEDFQTHREYIHSNPVHRGLVSCPEEFVWSSASGKLSLDERPPGLKPHPHLES
jgi:putative transposase